MKRDDTAARLPDNRLTSSPNLSGDLVRGAATRQYASRAMGLETTVNLSESGTDTVGHCYLLKILCIMVSTRFAIASG